MTSNHYITSEVDGLSIISQGFGLDFSELREYTLGFFSNVAEIMDDGFAQVYMALL
jgi:hypothetical protein